MVIQQPGLQPNHQPLVGGIRFSGEEKDGAAPKRPEDKKPAGEIPADKHSGHKPGCKKHEKPQNSEKDAKTDGDRVDLKTKDSAPKEAGDHAKNPPSDDNQPKQKQSASQPSFFQNLKLTAGFTLTSLVPLASGFLWVGGIPGMVLSGVISLISGAIGRRIMKGVDESQLSGPLTSLKRLNDMISNPESIKERLVAEGKLPKEVLDNPDALSEHHTVVMDAAVDEVLEGVLKLKIPYLAPLLKFALSGRSGEWVRRYLRMKLRSKSMSGKKAARVFAGANFNYEIANADSFPDAVKRGAKALWRSAKYLILWTLPEAMIKAGDGVKGGPGWMLKAAGHALRGIILLMGLRDMQQGFSQMDEVNDAKDANKPA